jgi:hypothetical protein
MGSARRRRNSAAGGGAARRPSMIGVRVTETIARRTIA